MIPLFSGLKKAPISWRVTLGGYPLRCPWWNGVLRIGRFHDVDLGMMLSDLLRSRSLLVLFWRFNLGTTKTWSFLMMIFWMFKKTSCLVSYPKHLFGFEVPSDGCFLIRNLVENLLGSRMRPRWLGYVYHSGQTNVKTGDSCLSSRTS